MSRKLPIIFNTDMIRIILDGRTTVTRRPVRHNTDMILNSPYGWDADPWVWVIEFERVVK